MRGSIRGNLRANNKGLNEVSTNLTVLTLQFDALVSTIFGRWYTRAVLWLFGITRKRVMRYYRKSYERMLASIRQKNGPAPEKTKKGE